MVPSDSKFDPAKHLSPADITVDSHIIPTLLIVHLKPISKARVSIYWSVDPPDFSRLSRFLPSDPGLPTKNPGKCSFGSSS